MLKTRNPSQVAPPAGVYSHSVEVPPNARWLVTAGQVGVRPDGTVPEGFEAQHDQIWQNTLAILADAGMGPENIVRLNVYSTDPTGLQFVKAHREKYLRAYPGLNLDRCQSACKPEMGRGDGDNCGQGVGWGRASATKTAKSNHCLGGKSRRRAGHASIKPGVSFDEGYGDAWPEVLSKNLATAILVVGTPIWTALQTSG